MSGGDTRRHPPVARPPTFGPESTGTGDAHVSRGDTRRHPPVARPPTFGPESTGTGDAHVSRGDTRRHSPVARPPTFGPESTGTGDAHVSRGDTRRHPPVARPPTFGPESFCLLGDTRISWLRGQRQKQHGPKVRDLPPYGWLYLGADRLLGARTQAALVPRPHSYPCRARTLRRLFSLMRACA